MRYSVMLWALAGAIIFSLLSPYPARAGTTENIFELLAGTWTATGNSFGPGVQSEMVWSKTLDGRFYKIDYRITMDAEGSKTFTGIGHYQATESNATVGYWADNSGDLHPLSVKIGKDAIISIWGVAGGKQGRTEYRLEDQGRLRVTDWLLTADGWRQFNRASFVRSPS